MSMPSSMTPILMPRPRFGRFWSQSAGAPINVGLVLSAGR